MTDERAIQALRDWWYSDKRVLTKSSMEHAKDIVSMLDRAGYVIVKKSDPARHEQKAPTT